MTFREDSRNETNSRPLQVMQQICDQKNKLRTEQNVTLIIY